jgi:hypothetical protein
VFFDNTECLTCERELGFLPEAGTLLGLEPPRDGVHATPYGPCKKCDNYSAHGVCNWLVPADAPDRLCRACRLNREMPDLTEPANRALWAELEKAKRRLLYTLDQLHLGVVSRHDEPAAGLAFDIAKDTGSERVLTGHSDALMTLKLARADDSARERTRVAFTERYRTLLGHFRHEIGHYFWERLVRDGDKLALFRERFGDERRDYAESLEAHLALAPSPTPDAEFITPYARCHPWEDWAETFAHYLLMLDTLDTAREFGFTGDLSPDLSLPGTTDFELLLEEWSDLTVALNALSRSVGAPEPYPVALSAVVREKLEVVHRIVREARASAAREAPRSAPYASGAPAAGGEPPARMAV